jgi:hypothetical protein
MRILAIGFAVLAAAAFGGVLVLAQIASGGPEPGPTVWELYLDSNPLEKISETTLVLCAVGIVVIGLLRGSDGIRSAAAILPYFAWAALAVGVLAALQGALQVWVAARAVHVTRFIVLAPSLAEATLALAIGLLCAALGFGLAPSRRAAAEATA